VVIDRRTTQGLVDRVPAIMQELVTQKVDVIVATGGPAVYAAHRATNRIPIVGLVDDILDMGVIDSLARPGHNLTGIGETDPMLHGKRLQMLREAAPSISRIAVICYHQGANDRGHWRKQLDAAAHAMNMTVHWLAVDAPEEYKGAFDTIVQKRIDALYVTTTHVNAMNAKRIARFALEHRLPSFGFPEDGMLMGYWADYKEVFRRAAAYVKKILDGAKPGDLPFEQPTKFELTLNLKAAKAIGLVIPQQMLIRADEVID
jgi:putative ABC transport system substrate-binding protein